MTVLMVLISWLVVSAFVCSFVGSAIALGRDSERRWAK